MPVRITKDDLLDPQAIPQIIAELRKLKEAMSSMQVDLRSEAKTLYDVWGQPIKITGESVQGFETAKTKVRALYNESKKLTAAERELEKAERGLQVALARQNPEYIKKVVQTQKAKEAAKQLLIEEQKLQGVYKKTSGVFSGLITQLKSLALAYIGLGGAIRFVRNVFDITKELSAMSMTFRQIIKDNYDLAEANGFLSDVTERYGLNLLETSKAYIKFRASAQASGLETEKTNKIFESFAKTGAVMGRNAEDMNLIFLALEQMLSKGRVSAEELRRQLGEKVPGAFIIMANSIGVTARELDKMLRAGEVISKDVLPKFADEIEKTFGIENVNRIENLIAAQNRLATAWIKFIDSLKASKLFEKALTNLAGFFDNLAWSIEKSASSGAALKFKEIKDDLKEIGKEGNSEAVKEALYGNIQKAYKMRMVFANQLQEIEDKLKNTSVFSLKQIAELSKQKETTESLRQEYDLLGRMLQDLYADPQKLKQFWETQSDTAIELLGYITEIDEKIKILNETIKSSRDKREIFRASQEIDNLENIKKYYEGMSFDNNSLKETQKRYENIVSAIKSARVLGWSPERTKGMEDELNTTRDLISAIEYKTMLDGIDEYNKKDMVKIMQDLNDENEEYLKFIEEVEKQAGEIAEIDADILGSFGLLEKQEYDQKRQELKRLLEERKITEGTYISESIQLWANYNDKAIEIFGDIQDSIGSLLYNIAQAEINAAEQEIEIYDDKISELERQLDEEKRLKDEGRANDYNRMVAQIAEQQKLRKQANDDLAKAQKRQAQIQLAQQAGDIATSAASIIADLSGKGGWIGALVGIASAFALLAEWQAYKNQVDSIGKYAEGTEDLQGPGTEKSDSIPIMASKHERIVPADTNKKLDGFPNELLPDAVSLWRLNFKDLTKYNYQKHSGVDELVKEYRKQTEYSKRIIEAIQENPQAIPIENSDHNIVVMMISKKGRKVELRTISKK